MQTPRPTHRYARFYKESADFPEQLKFRRFADQWFKKLFDDEEELLSMQRHLDHEIAEFCTRTGRIRLENLDCPRMLIKGEGKLYNKWMRYEAKLRAHSQDIILVHDLYKLPDHGAYASARLNDWPQLFKDGLFGPTNEEGGAAAYQDPKSPDFVAVVGIQEYDVLMDLAVDHIDWIDRNIIKRIRRLLRMGPGPNHIRLPTVIAFFDAMTCIFVPFILTTMMFALAHVSRPMVRIAVVGVFGLVFAVSARLLSGHISHSSMFSLIAAYFAVASVFVSTTGNNGGGSV